MNKLIELLFPYRTHLQTELIIQRNDFLDRLHEKDARIQQLESELALVRGKLDRVELVLLPLSSAAGAAYARTLTPATSAPPKVPQSALEGSWQNYLKSQMAQAEREEKEHANV